MNNSENLTEIRMEDLEFAPYTPFPCAPFKLMDRIEGNTEIECEYCGRISDIKLRNCPSCGAPLAIKNRHHTAPEKKNKPEPQEEYEDRLEAMQYVYEIPLNQTKMELRRLSAILWFVLVAAAGTIAYLVCSLLQ